MKSALDKQHGALTGYETTEFTTTDGSLNARSKGKKYGVDFTNRDQQSETETEAETAYHLFSSPLDQQNKKHQGSSGLPAAGSDDHENLYTTEMEDADDVDLNTRKQIIRSELKDANSLEPEPGEASANVEQSQQ